MPKKIMVVDDEPGILKMVAFRLANSGYEVVTAQDGADALEKIRQSAPDLLVLDIMMPIMDGNELCQILKQDPNTKDIPIIFLTALRTGEDAADEGETVGSNIILPKPFDPVVLLSTVKRILGE